MAGRHEEPGTEVNHNDSVDSADSDEEDDVFFCMSGEGSEDAEGAGEADCRQLFQQRGATAGRVKTNSFNSRRTYVVK